VNSLNFHRRHLSVTQKACISVGYKKEIQETVEHGGDKKSEKYHSGNISSMIKDIEEIKDDEPNLDDAFDLPAPPRSAKAHSTKRAPQARDKAAAMVGVSGKTTDEAEKIEEVAPDLFAQMQRGEKTLSEARKEIAQHTPRNGGIITTIPLEDIEQVDPPSKMEGGFFVACVCRVRDIPSPLPATSA